eukprot:scaffold2178_cov123-Skeletonema_dohrnii-CCMP3373.AAC.2
MLMISRYFQRGRYVLGSNRQYMRWASSFSPASDLHCQVQVGACCTLHRANLVKRFAATLREGFSRSGGEFTPGGHKVIFLRAASHAYSSSPPSFLLPFRVLSEERLPIKYIER